MFLGFHGNLLNSQLDTEPRVMIGFKYEVSYRVQRKKILYLTKVLSSECTLKKKGLDNQIYIMQFFLHWSLKKNKF